MVNKVLTARGVKYEKTIGRHADAGCKGLCLNIKAGADGNLSRSWIYRYTHPIRKTKNGHPARVEMGLGAVDALRLENARALASHWREVLQAGNDPITVRDAEARRRQTALTFEECAQQYIQTNRTEWKSEKHAQQWENTLKTYVYPIIGRLEPKDIDSDLIVQVLQPIWITKAETASRIRQRIEAILGWAGAKKLTSGDNPARLLNHLKNLLPPQKSKAKRVRHHPAVPYEKINMFIKTLRAKPSVSALALEFTLLTATRTSEVLKARWDEINLEHRIWTLPATRMKAGKQHTVPLNEGSINILQRQLAVRESDYVFTVLFAGQIKTLSSGAMLQLMRGMPAFNQYVPHGLRSTFTDWANEVTEHPHPVIEMALAHAIKSSTERAYRRGELIEKRQVLMADWFTYLETEQP
jgi:integrase